MTARSKPKKARKRPRSSSEPAASAHPDLTARQSVFVDQMLLLGNGTQAAIAAGYSEHTAPQQAARLLKNVKVKAALKAARLEQSQRTRLDADRVLLEFQRIAFADVRDLFTWDEERSCFVPSRDLTSDQAAAISSVKSKTTRFTTEDGNTTERIELELKTYDKLPALNTLAKHLGILKERDDSSDRPIIAVIGPPPKANP
jgi:phage terminase small subunit